MKTSDDIVELSKFKYDLFESSDYILKDRYFNDENKIDNINLFKDLLSSRDGKYYHHISIINKMLSIIGNANFIHNLPCQEQLEIIHLIKIMLKNNIIDDISEEEFLEYKDRIINEYYMIQNIMYNQNLSINYDLLKLFGELIFDYPNVFFKNDFLIKRIREYINISESNRDNCLSKMKRYLCSQYMIVKGNKIARNLVVR